VRLVFPTAQRTFPEDASPPTPASAKAIRDFMKISTKDT
jgi:hypothetical protein